MKERKDNFGSRFAVVMAMAGSAVGLGNIWRFPYMVGEHGGAAFIIIYLACCLLVSLPMYSMCILLLLLHTILFLLHSSNLHLLMFHFQCLLPLLYLLLI